MFVCLFVCLLVCLFVVCLFVGLLFAVYGRCIGVQVSILCRVRHPNCLALKGLTVADGKLQLVR